MKSSFIFILLIVSASLVTADTVVEYIYGIIEIKKESSWVELMPGDSIPDGSVFRVGENSIVELSGDKTKFSLTNPGIYSIDSIVLSSFRSLKANSMIFNTIRRLFRHLPSRQSTVLGVRAAEVPDSGFTWNNDNYAEYLDAGKVQLEQENYTEAGISFSDAMGSAFDDFEEEEALFYLAYAEALSGNSSGALGLITNFSPDPDASYYEQAVLLKANLLVENFSADKAISWIGSYKMQNLDITGSLILLEGMANFQLGKIETARGLFEQVIMENTGSESAEIASEYIGFM